MGITSKTFMVVLALAALSACGLAVWLWPRLAGPGPRALSGRFGLLVASQLLLVALALIFCNAYFGFYTSWSDLFGNGSQHFHVNNKGAVAADVNATQLTGATQSPTALSANSITTLDLTGLRSGINARLRVYVPPQYSDPKQPQQTYPAIVVDATGGQTAAAEADALSRAPHPVQAVVVIVDTANGSNIPCADQPGGVQGGLFWGQDLRSAIAAHYRVGPGAGSWGALGTGPAAGCALAFALADSSRYSAAAVVSPAQTSFDPKWWLNTYPAPPSRILLAGVAGSPDGFLGHVRPPLQVTMTANTDNQSALDWLAQTLQQGLVRP